MSFLGKLDLSLVRKKKIYHSVSAFGSSIGTLILSSFGAAMLLCGGMGRMFLSVTKHCRLLSSKQVGLRHEQGSLSLDNWQVHYGILQVHVS